MNPTGSLPEPHGDYLIPGFLYCRSLPVLRREWSRVYKVVELEPERSGENPNVNYGRVT